MTRLKFSFLVKKQHLFGENIPAEFRYVKKTSCSLKTVWKKWEGSVKNEMDFTGPYMCIWKRDHRGPLENGKALLEK